MRAAQQVVLRDAQLAEQARQRLEVERFAVMAGRAEREIGRAQMRARGLRQQLDRDLELEGLAGAAEGRQRVESREDPHVARGIARDGVDRVHGLDSEAAPLFDKQASHRAYGGSEVRFSQATCGAFAPEVVLFGHCFRSSNMRGWQRRMSIRW